MDCQAGCSSSLPGKPSRSRKLGMTVAELVEQLKQLPQDLLVAVYAFEDGDLVKSVAVHNEDDLFFITDSIHYLYNLPKDQEIVFIKGIN